MDGSEGYRIVRWAEGYGRGSPGFRDVSNGFSLIHGLNGITVVELLCVWFSGWSGHERYAVYTFLKKYWDKMGGKGLLM